MRHISVKCEFSRIFDWPVEYSCFEKGCPTKLHATMPKAIMGNRVWGCFSDIEENSTNKCIYAFSFSCWETPWTSINQRFLPMIPIGIVAYAFTLLWDNLCRNSCIRLKFDSWFKRRSLHVPNLIRTTCSINCLFGWELNTSLALRNFIRQKMPRLNQISRTYSFESTKIGIWFGACKLRRLNWV